VRKKRKGAKGKIHKKSTSIKRGLIKGKRGESHTKQRKEQVNWASTEGKKDEQRLGGGKRGGKGTAASRRYGIKVGGHGDKGDFFSWRGKKGNARQK